VDVEQPTFGRTDADETTDPEASSSGGEDAEPADGDGPASTTATSSEPDSGDADAPASCGNGQLDADEDCDGQQFAVTCEDFGFDGGDLSCTPSCVVSTAGCIGCGNGIIERGEACDGNDLGGETCQSLGYASGLLACGDDCSLATDACVEPVCGDGTLNGDEACDGQDFGGQTCASIDPGFVGGELACAADCSTIDTDACLEPVCGDGMANGDELCDGGDFAGKTCKTEGFNAGDLTCSQDCMSVATDGCFYCAEPAQSCAVEACCPGSTCTDFGFGILLCI
jgi:hypothetical protein